ncbi:MAG: dihydrolipoamide acetyltransferase family protein [Rhodoferax sp.]|nr:dihydrolipoamide acetyltransferase family protein [Rhodoferax sp.]
MTIQNIKMPDIGEGIAEVELVAWRVAVGDAVAEDQIVADVMTDKATVEIPSHLAGTVLSLDAAVGQVVPVGTPIIHIETAVEQAGQAQAATKSEASQPPVVAAAVASSAAVVPPPRPTPSGSGSDNAADLPPALPAGPLGLARGAGHALAAPAVRQRAKELGINLASVTATGSAGQITHADLDRSLNSSTTDSYQRTSDKGLIPLEATETIPVIGLRRKIAQKMQDAKRRIPHFTYVEEVDVTELEALRAQLNAEHGKTRGRLTLLPLLVRALVLALRDHPEINARYDDDGAVITRYAAVHLGLATQTDGGLMVPVIRHAEALDLWACAAEITRLAESARSGRAAREELSGSTITVTSLGPLAGIAHTPVINHPEVAIVGPNRIVERPMVRNGRIEVRKMMNISSSFDHRVVDGMNAAQFIQRLRVLLECPATLFTP